MKKFQDYYSISIYCIVKWKKEGEKGSRNSRKKPILKEGESKKPRNGRRAYIHSG